MAKLICGIDPGMSGAFALLADGELVEVADMPIIEVNGKRRLNAAAAAEIVIRFNAAFTVIEAVSAMPKQGVSSTFKFGCAYGMARGIIGALGIKTVLVRPAKWKKFFALGAEKEKSRELAINLWPRSEAFQRKKDHGRAEAALLALYGAYTILD